MAVYFNLTSLQELWNLCNIRGFVITSLCLQLLLGSSVRLRKKSTNRLLVLVIWSAYFMADWVATFTFGMISNAQRVESISPPEVNENLLAFWAAFLLIHLGGPDTITAYSLEDNALWVRHLVGLVAQLLTFLYIFLKTLPGNNLVAPTVLIAVAGVIKYADRTRALYLASMENLKKSIEKLPTSRVGDLSGGRYRDDRSKEAYHFFQIFRGLTVDIMPNHEERSQSSEFFRNVNARTAFRVMETELDLLYEMFYTKILSLSSLWGVVARIITHNNMVAALVLYGVSKKEGFHEVDILITYFLLAGVILMEISGVIMFVFSEWSGPRRWFHVLWFLEALLFIPMMIVYVGVFALVFLCGCEDIWIDSWCEKLGAFSLLSHCVGQCHGRDGKAMKYARMIFRFITGEPRGHVSWNAFNTATRDFIFEELKERTAVADDERKVKEIYETRGSWILTKLGNAKEELVRSVTKFDYNKSLLAWHIATELCNNADRAVDAADIKQRKLAVMLSDYMNYLLIKKPDMMSTVAGIAHIRYRDTCAEVKHYCRVFKAKNVYEFSSKMLNEDTSIGPANVYRDKGASVLSEACNLARSLRLVDNRWEIMSGVWVELMMYAAGHCRPEKHARALSEGGELVTFVWLLMAHLGIGPHFPHPEG